MIKRCHVEHIFSRMLPFPYINILSSIQRRADEHGIEDGDADAYTILAASYEYHRRSKPPTHYPCATILYMMVYRTATSGN
jgi:hypothetical protein